MYRLQQPRAGQPACAGSWGRKPPDPGAAPVTRETAAERRGLGFAVSGAPRGIGDQARRGSVGERRATTACKAIAARSYTDEFARADAAGQCSAVSRASLRAPAILRWV